MQFDINIGSQDAIDLLNAWEFERRKQHDQKDTRPDVFPDGELHDWAGVTPDSDWQDVVSGYRAASQTLAASSPHLTHPYLFLCRHTIELQLKAIVMIGQQWLRVEPDLPGHHDLQRLWTAALPIAHAKLGARLEKAIDLALVRSLIDSYHQVDSGSFAFRYPVGKNNRAHSHQAYLYRFSASGHHQKFERVADGLNKVILSLRYGLMFSTLSR